MDEYTAAGVVRAAMAPKRSSLARSAPRDLATDVMAGSVSSCPARRLAFKQFA